MEIASSDWKLYYNDQGSPFYYNTRSGETSWNPQVVSQTDLTTSTTPTDAVATNYALLSQSSINGRFNMGVGWHFTC